MLADVNSIVDVQFRIYAEFKGGKNMIFPTNLVDFYELKAACPSSLNSIIEPPDLQKTYDFYRSENGIWKSIFLHDFKT